MDDKTKSVIATEFNRVNDECDALQDQIQALQDDVCKLYTAWEKKRDEAGPKIKALRQQLAPLAQSRQKLVYAMDGKGLQRDR